MNCQSYKNLQPKSTGLDSTGIIGIVLTIVYLGLGIALYSIKKTDFHGLSLNEFGDFLAGYFGPLALGWLVLGFFQQRRELSLNTHALHLQYEELRDSVEQQKQLVSAAEGARADEKQRILEACRPTFAITFKGSAGNASNFELTNTGSPIYETKLEYTSNVLNTGDGFLGSYTSTWETNGLRKIRVALDGEQNGVMGISYRDQLGNQEKASFDLKQDPGKVAGRICEISERRRSNAET